MELVVLEGGNTGAAGGHEEAVVHFSFLPMFGGRAVEEYYGILGSFGAKGRAGSFDARERE